MTHLLSSKRSRAPIRRLALLAWLVWMMAVVVAASSPTASFAADPAVTSGDAAPPVYMVEATGVVDNVMAGYIEEAVARATESASPALIVTINTPGGSLDATQRIVSALLEAPLPTIVWVAPSGGRAASAGTFITLSANLAYMAPGTNIGAASPVGAGGAELEGTIATKVRNDAIANIRSIAETRGRNVEWAASTVSDAVSSSATEAVALGVVDGIAISLDDVRRMADGQVVDVRGSPVTVDIASAPVVDLPMNPFQSIIHLLSDPNIAFILLTLGFYGLLFELQSPNFVTGIIGAIAIILAFIGFGSLPLNVAGLLLIGLAVILFLLEFTVTSHGLLAVGGLICFVLGAFALYTAPGSPTAPDVSVAVPLVVAMSAVTVGFVLIVLTTVVRSRRRGLVHDGAYGAGGSHVVPAGSDGVARTTIAPTGVVVAAGEEWSARSSDGDAIEIGSPVHVVGQVGLTLIVTRAVQESAT